MKKNALILILLALLASCKPTEKETFLISGTIKNTMDKELKLTIGSRMDTLKMNPDGTFTKEINLPKATEATLQGSKLYAYLYLTPGKDLAIMADGADFNKDVSFTGTQAPENEYLLTKMQEEQNNQEKLFKHYQSPYTPEDFRKFCDSLRLDNLDKLTGFKSEKGKPSEEFITLQKQVIQFGYLNYLEGYPTMAGYYSTDKPVIPENWYSFMDGINLDDPALLEISEAKYFVQAYVDNQAMKLSGIPREQAYNNPAVMAALFKVLKEKFTHPEFFNKIAFDKLKGTIDSEGPGGIEELVKEYMSTSTDEQNKKDLQTMLDGWASMAAGKPAPVFNLPDIDGKMVSLTDFAGKYVFIDFWATWCGPCKAEIPSYKQLISDYKAKNIVFISISVDKDKAAWEKMVKEGIPEIDENTGKPVVPAKMQSMDWLQLHDALKYNKLWLVKFIPTFVLIDPTGNIVNSRALRPSNPELRKVLDGLAGI